MQPTHLIPLFLASGLLTACGSSGGGGGGATTTLSGTVANPGGAGIPGVVLRVESATRMASATSDADGNFIVLAPPTGAITLHVDSSGVNPGLGDFPDLEVPLTLGSGAGGLEQPLVLTDLGGGVTQTLPVDAGGATVGAANLLAPDGSELIVADMTTIEVDGAPADIEVELNLTPVRALDVPMPLPDALDTGSFVTIQPPGASFDPPLGLRLPNPRRFPLGTTVDVWSFDHDQGRWVNRSDETGRQGLVVDVMGTSMIVADGVVTEGGWHAGAVPVDVDCATTLTGRVRVAGTTDPLPAALLSLSSGQFARTDAEGRFTIALVPAYDAEILPTCVAIDVGLAVRAPVAFGAARVTQTVPGGTILPGGITDLGTIDVPATDTGALVGSVSDNGLPVAGTVSISGAASLQVEAVDGAFFVASLAFGSYTASFDFSGTVVNRPFTVLAHETTSIRLRLGGNDRLVNVRVIAFDDVRDAIPSERLVAGAFVTLVGASGAPLFASTGGNGIAEFRNAPSGPYTVTAQVERPLPFGRERAAVSVVGANPSSSPRTITLPFFEEPVPPVSVDGFLGATVSNAPIDHVLRYQASDRGTFLSDSAVDVVFSDNIPSEVPLDFSVSAIDVKTLEVTSVVVFSGLTVASGQGLNLDFDFAGANACPFDRKVDLTASNPPFFTGATVQLALGELEFDFPADNGLPSFLRLPDLSSVKLADLAATLDVRLQEPAGDLLETGCTLPLGSTTPPSILVDLLGVPSIQSPTQNELVEGFGPGNIVRFTEGLGNGQNAGTNRISFRSERLEDVDLVLLQWDLYTAPGTGVLLVPPLFLGKPQFGDAFTVMTFDVLRFEFPAFSFPVFFDGDFSSHLAAVQQGRACDGAIERSFRSGVEGLPLTSRRRTCATTQP